jgi:hypothetical protein
MKSSQIIRPQATPTFSQKLPIAEMEFCTPETLNIWSFRVWEHLKKEWQTMYEKNSYLLQRHFKPFNSVVLGLVPQKLDKNPRSFNPALTKDSICTRKVVKWFKVLQQQEGSQTCSGMWLNETLNITRTPSDTAKWSTGRPANLRKSSTGQDFMTRIIPSTRVQCDETQSDQTSVDIIHKIWFCRCQKRYIYIYTCKRMAYQGDGGGLGQHCRVLPLLSE